MTRAAAVCSPVLGFDLPGAFGAWYHARYGEVWTLLGFSTFATGP